MLEAFLLYTKLLPMRQATSGGQGQPETVCALPNTMCIIAANMVPVILRTAMKYKMSQKPGG